MNQNFNSNTSEQYSLHASNEQVETNLPPNALSSASNFEVNLSPALDLNQLSYLQSTDVEVTYQHITCFLMTHPTLTLLKTIFFLYLQTRIGSLCLDSSPLFLRQDKKEVIKTFLTISPSLARNNMSGYTQELAEKRNTTPLVVKVSDYYTDNIPHALNHINSLLTNGSNLFLIARYAELFLDNQAVFNFEVFQNLSVDNVLDVTKSELELLLSYIEWGLFTRLEALKYLCKLIGKTADINHFVDPKTISFKRPPLTKSEEYLILAKSYLLSSHNTRKILYGGVNPIFLIPLDGFYEVDLTSSSEEDNSTSDGATSKKRKRVDENPEKRVDENPENTRKRDNIKAYVQKQTLNYLRLYVEGDIVEGKLDSRARKLVDEVISSHVKLLKLGKKLQLLIHIELERLNLPKESTLFSRPAVAVGVDSSETKVKFYFEYSKLSEYSELTITLPRIMSYKLGVSKDLNSQKYNKITIGPISLATQFTTGTATGIAHNITSSKQRLSTPIRLFPKLLVVSTDFLSEQSRQAEKDLVFFSTDDMVNFFKVPLKQKELNRQFLAVDTSLTPNQPFFRVHKARSYLNSFKINLRDECGELLSFSRDTIVKINFFFRACNIDRM